MGGLFDPENGLWRTVGTLADVLGLSVMWLVFCLPVVTIGPASAALYYSVVKCVRRGESKPFRNFWDSFCANLRVGAAATLPCVAGFLLLLFERASLLRMTEAGDPMASVLYVTVNLLLLFAFGFFSWLFPLLSRFEAGVGSLFRAALQLFLRHLPTTVCLAALNSLLALLTLQFWFLLSWAVTPALAALLSSFLLERVLKKLTPEHQSGEEEEPPWYLK